MNDYSMEFKTKCLEAKYCPEDSCMYIVYLEPGLDQNQTNQLSCVRYDTLGQKQTRLPAITVGKLGGASVYEIRHRNKFR